MQMTAGDALMNTARDILFGRNETLGRVVTAVPMKLFIISTAAASCLLLAPSLLIGIHSIP